MAKTIDSPNNVKRLRRAAGMTQEDLADQIGVSVSQLSRIERGKRGLALEHAIMIARVLQVPVHEVDEKFSVVLTPRESQDAAMDRVLTEDFPLLSQESQQVVLDTIRRLKTIEGREPG